MTSAAGDRPCIEMGSRRTHEEAAVAAARAAYIAGFATTSNLEAGRRFGVPTAGTAAHAFTLLHDDEREAFDAQIAALGKGTTLLVDTYDVPTAVALAVELAGPELGGGAARLRRPAGPGAGGARPARRGSAPRTPRSSSPATSTSTPSPRWPRARWTPTAWARRSSPDSGAPTAGMVYKLSPARTTTGDDGRRRQEEQGQGVGGGRKYALRRRNARGIAEAEVIGIGRPPFDDGDDRELLVPLLSDGEVVDATVLDLDAARARTRASRAELPAAARRLQRGEPAIPTLYQD